MKLPGDYQNRNSRLSLKYMMVGVSLCLLFILGMVIVTNKQKEESRKKALQEETTVMALEHEDASRKAADADGENGGSETAEGIETEQSADGTNSENAPMVSSFSGRKSMQDIQRLYKENRLTASDLDIWDMYSEENTEDVYEEEKEEESEKKTSKYEEAAERIAEEEAEKNPGEDGKHTLLTYADGTEEWVLINPYLERSSIDFTKLKKKADKMSYYENGKKASYVGVDISKYNGDVDFRLLRESGVDYVMIRLGARGYGSGEIILDEKYTDYMAKAAEAGLDVGVYFFSQAITPAEAVEEANFVIQNLTNYKITYPVAFDMEYVQNDKARIESLSRAEKTEVAKAFLDTVKNAGYTPMIYGTKEWLIKEIDLTALTEYDVWLSQQKDVPDYPYQFQMWQYTTEGSISGINGDADLNISFVDYAEK